MNTEKRTALYCRVSKEDDLLKESSSIETQKEYLKRYAKENGFTNIRIYVDDGCSGTNFDRPGFNKLVMDIYSQKVHTVITKDLSRLGRDYLVTGYYLEHFFPLNNIRFISINDMVDSSESSNDFIPFRNIINEWYSKDISKKIRTAYRVKAINGKYTGPYAPYGYVKDPNDKNKLIVFEKQAKIVKMIFKLFCEGITPYKIANRLKEMNVKTPRASLYEHYGVYKSKKVINFPFDWSTQTIRGFLQNQVYIGYMVSNKHQTKSFKSKKLQKNKTDDWIVVKGVHEPIISEASFIEAQKLLKKGNQLKTCIVDNIFKGILRCGNCGSILTLHQRNNNTSHKSFSCGNYRMNTEYCSSHYISYVRLESLILRKINKLIKISRKGKECFLYEVRKEIISQKVKRKRKEIKEGENNCIRIDSYTLDKHLNSHNMSSGKVLDISVLKVESKISELYNIIESYKYLKELSSKNIETFLDRVIASEVINYKGKKVVKAEIYFKFIGLY